MTPKKTQKIRFKYLRHIPYKAMDRIGSVESLVLHTALFIGIFALRYFGTGWETILLILTTLVSLEAIYLAIFIQMAVNKTNQSLQDVEEDIEEIQEEMEDLGEGVVSLQEDVEEISEDIDEIATEDLDGHASMDKNSIVLNNIESQLQFLIKEVEILKNHRRGGVGQ